MNKEFSSYLKNNLETLEKIINVLKKKYKYVSILASDVEGKNVNISDKEIKVSDSKWQERGFVIRVYDGCKYSEYSFNDIPSIKSICDKVISSENVDEIIDKTIYLSSCKYNLVEDKPLIKDFSRMDKFEEVPINEIIQKCERIIHNSMEENEYIISCNCNVETVKISKMFLSCNRKLTQVYGWACASYNCILNRDEIVKFNFGGQSSISTKEALSKMEKQVQSINKNAQELLDSEKVISGEYDCITSPIITGLLAHEAFGHGVEMDMFVKNRAMAQKYMNNEICSKNVTMHDGAIPYEDVSSYFFDDEGILAHDTIEIKNGVLVNGIADSLSALKLNLEPTGNGKRESYKRKAYTRMTTTYFEKGTSTLKEMISSIKYGFLIDGELSGMEDPKNWGIQCVCLYGREIKNGEFTGKYVSPIVITGYVPNILKSISMISNDFNLYGNGMCCKGYKERVKTSIGGPYLKVRLNLG